MYIYRIFNLKYALHSRHTSTRRRIINRLAESNSLSSLFAFFFHPPLISQRSILPTLVPLTNPDACVGPFPSARNRIHTLSLTHQATNERSLRLCVVGTRRLLHIYIYMYSNSIRNTFNVHLFCLKYSLCCIQLNYTDVLF